MNIKQRMKVKEIAEATSLNMHSTALRIGISLLGESDIKQDLSDRLSIIEYNHEKLGYLPSKLSSERYDVYSEFKAFAIREFSHEDYSKIYDAF